MSIPRAKGVFDLYPTPQSQGERWKDSWVWRHVEALARSTCDLYGFQEVRTPCFERSELFQRTVGKTSDIVSKEMYTFADRAGRSLSLRPEGTAPVIRALLDEILQQGQPLYKLFYLGPMFRYERQQAGRYRQHHQVGAEIIGDGSPERDAELIDLLMSFYKALGLKQLNLQLNTLGDPMCRDRFRLELVTYLKPLKSKLSRESVARLEVNPLRVLDSKAPQDQEIVAHGPQIHDFLSEASREHFDAVKRHLDALALDYQVVPTLVRGLDYYTRTVFEVTAGELGAQNSIGGGGRYDDLIASMGGPNLPALGFGTGLERIVQTLLGQGAPVPRRPCPTLLLIPLGEAAKKLAFRLLKELRSAHISAEVDLASKRLKTSLRFAQSLQAKFVLVIGDEELKSGQCELKEMESHTTKPVRIEDLVQHLRGRQP